MTRIGAQPFNWISAYCGAQDLTDLLIHSGVLDRWPYDNAGHIQIELSVKDRAKKLVLRYLKQLEESSNQIVTLDEIAAKLGIPVEIVESVCNEAELELYEDEE